MSLPGRRRAPAAIVVAATALLAAGCGPRQKLLQWGWDEPDTSFLRRNIREMEKSPFDGCVFSVRLGPGEPGGSFTWQFWGRRGFGMSDVTAAANDLRALRPRRFTENFLRVNVTPGDVDWFGDFSPVAANARLAGELATAAQARGILLDVEQYQGRLFDYKERAQSPSRSWDACAAQVRRRGREVMAAFQEGAPGLTVFLTFGHSLPRVLSGHGQKPLSETQYGLLAPFLDGLLEAGRGRTRVVDGYELSYGFWHAQQFAHARKLVAEGVRPIVGAPEAYRKRLQLGFGLWLDYDWRHKGWSPTDHRHNYFTPAAFETAVAAALEATDEYVWIYGETPRWWGSTDPKAAVPEAYRRAIRRAWARTR
jgi:hypothetical protein